MQISNKVLYACLGVMVAAGVSVFFPLFGVGAVVGFGFGWFLLPYYFDWVRGRDKKRYEELKKKYGGTF